MYSIPSNAQSEQNINNGIKVFSRPNRFTSYFIRLTHEASFIQSMMSDEKYKDKTIAFITFDDQNNCSLLVKKIDGTFSKTIFTNTEETINDKLNNLNLNRDNNNQLYLDEKVSAELKNLNLTEENLQTSIEIYHPFENSRAWAEKELIQFGLPEHEIKECLILLDTPIHYYKKCLPESFPQNIAVVYLDRILKKLALVYFDKDKNVIIRDPSNPEDLIEIKNSIKLFTKSNFIVQSEELSSKLSFMDTDQIQSQYEENYNEFVKRLTTFNDNNPILYKWLNIYWFDNHSRFWATKFLTHQIQKPGTRNGVIFQNDNFLTACYHDGNEFIFKDLISIEDMNTLVNFLKKNDANPNAKFLPKEFKDYFLKSVEEKNNEFTLDDFFENLRLRNNSNKITLTSFDYKKIIDNVCNRLNELTKAQYFDEIIKEIMPKLSEKITFYTPSSSYSLSALRESNIIEDLYIRIVSTDLLTPKETATSNCTKYPGEKICTKKQVKFTNDNGVSYSFNANYYTHPSVNYLRGKKDNIIISEGPTLTHVDAYTCLFEKFTGNTIICLANENYYPTGVMKFKNNLTFLSEQSVGDFKVITCTTPSNKKIDVFIYNKWPDFGVITVKELCQLCKTLCQKKLLMPDSPSTTIVHCRGGQGRSAALILAMDFLTDNRSDIYESVLNMRTQRFNVLNTPEQLELLFSFIAHLNSLENPLVKAYYSHDRTLINKIQKPALNIYNKYLYFGNKISSDDFMKFLSKQNYKAALIYNNRLNCYIYTKTFYSLINLIQPFDDEAIRKKLNELNLKPEDLMPSQEITENYKIPFANTKEWALNKFNSSAYYIKDDPTNLPILIDKPLREIRDICNAHFCSFFYIDKSSESLRIARVDANTQFRFAEVVGFDQEDSYNFSGHFTKSLLLEKLTDTGYSSYKHLITGAENSKGNPFIYKNNDIFDYSTHFDILHILKHQQVQQDFLNAIATIIHRMIVISYKENNQLKFIYTDISITSIAELHNILTSHIKIVAESAPSNNESIYKYCISCTSNLKSHQNLLSTFKIIAEEENKNPSFRSKKLLTNDYIDHIIFKLLEKTISNSNSNKTKKIKLLSLKDCSLDALHETNLIAKEYYELENSHSGRVIKNKKLNEWISFSAINFNYTSTIVKIKSQNNELVKNCKLIIHLAKDEFENSLNARLNYRFELSQVSEDNPHFSISKYYFKPKNREKKIAQSIDVITFTAFKSSSCENPITTIQLYEICRVLCSNYSHILSMNNINKNVEQIIIQDEDGLGKAVLLSLALYFYLDQSKGLSEIFPLVNGLKTERVEAMNDFSYYAVLYEFVKYRDEIRKQATQT